MYAHVYLVILPENLANARISETFMFSILKTIYKKLFCFISKYTLNAFCLQYFNLNECLFRSGC